MASKKDIAAMKIGAITNRGSKKDFTDLFILLDHFSITQILDFYQEKFPEGNLWLAKRSLSYFADADKEPMPQLHIDVSWEAIKEGIRDKSKNGEAFPY